MSAHESLLTDLRGVFGERLISLCTFGRSAPDVSPSSSATEQLHALAVVDSLTFADLTACAALGRQWERSGIATPLMLQSAELARSVDAFPLEYAEIMATRHLIAGPDPFASITPKTEDIRRACEVQAKSHLLHLREAFVEAAGRGDALARLIAASAAPFRALLAHVARLEGREAASDAALVACAAAIGLLAPVAQQILAARRPGDLKATDAERLYPAYLEATERLARYVDEWNR